ncbi:MAG TPA: BrnT family toxin [Coxiellaceae bacterium]|nr:BrnT family toxin [Coxiellaceae bacterium]
MASFEWDNNEERSNRLKHGVSFYETQKAFLDEKRVIVEDLGHSENELRYYCLGKIKDRILTVRFTYRDDNIRIIGAGFWRNGELLYEKAQKI